MKTYPAPAYIISRRQLVWPTNAIPQHQFLSLFLNDWLLFPWFTARHIKPTFAFGKLHKRICCGTSRRPCQQEYKCNALIQPINAYLRRVCKFATIDVRFQTLALVWNVLNQKYVNWMMIETPCVGVGTRVRWSSPLYADRTARLTRTNAPFVRRPAGLGRAWISSTGGSAAQVRKSPLSSSVFFILGWVYFKNLYDNVPEWRPLTWPDPTSSWEERIGWHFVLAFSHTSVTKMEMK